MAADHHLHAMPSEANLCNAFMQGKAKVSMQRPGSTLEDKHGPATKRKQAEASSQRSQPDFQYCFSAPRSGLTWQGVGEECARKERDRGSRARASSDASAG